MTMSWSDAVTESTRKTTHPPQRCYVPPHLRDGGSSLYGYGYSNESTQYGFRSCYSGFGRQAGPTGPSRGGRGRGRGGRFWAQPPPNPSPSQEPNPFGDVSEKFDQLKVTEGEDNNGGINFEAYDDIPVDASGEDIPPPVDTFQKIDLGECLNNNIKRCKYVKPTPVQRHAIPIAIAGRDLMACAQTGSGKTAAFCFPIISGILNNSSAWSQARGRDRAACPYALILSPTRELATQIHDEAKKFAYQSGVRIVVAYGGAPISQQFRNLERGVDILVATPGRLVDMIERSRVSLSMIKYLALDEADRMLDMGFEAQIRRIVDQMGMPRPGARQTLLFSATFPNEIQRLAADFLSNYIFLAVGRVGSSTDLIAQKVDFVNDMDKRNHLVQLLHGQLANAPNGKFALTLVFVETKRGADGLENWLCMNGFPAIAIHGDKVQMERERALKSFKCGACPILVATDVASRGLDIPLVAHVVNFDLPKSIDDYVHRIGRTGRAGNSGLATAFFNEKNQPLAKGLIELMKESNQEVPDWLNDYAEGQHSYIGGTGGGRSQRSGGSRFGGYDFRNAPQSAREDSYGPSSYGYGDRSLGASAASYPNAYGYGDCSVGTSAASYNDAAAVPCSFGNYETIVAGGWE